MARIQTIVAAPSPYSPALVTLAFGVLSGTVCQFLGGGWLRRLDRLVHRFDRIDDVVAMWDVSRARDAAWTNAEALWALRGDRDLYDWYLATLDRTVGFAGRGLLVPAEGSREIGDD